MRCLVNLMNIHYMMSYFFTLIGKIVNILHLIRYLFIKGYVNYYLKV